MATHLFEAGALLCWIQRFLGHSNLQTTLIYLHLTDDANVDGREQLNHVADAASTDKLFERFIGRDRE